MGESQPTAAAETHRGATPAATGAADLFRVTDPIVVRQPISGDVNGVRAAIEDRVADAGDPAPPGALLPDADVATCSVFLETGDRTTGDDGGATLTWYLEVPDASEGWRSPAARLLECSPVFDEPEVRAALDHGNATVHRPEEALVHARLPQRPGVPAPVAVVLVRVGFRPGLPSLAMRGIDRLVRALRGTWFEERMAGDSREVLEAERMWTETLWLVESGDEGAGAGLLWYMEAEEMAQVMEAYEDSETFVARASAWLLDRVLTTPLSTLGDPSEAGTFELLVHLTDPERG